jgi:hypothetical protein
VAMTSTRLIKGPFSLSWQYEIFASPLDLLRY